MRKKSHLIYFTCYPVLFLIFTCCFCYSEELISGNPNVSNMTIDIYWTDTAPVLDGKMDDPCWKKDASIAKDFKIRMGSGIKPTQQTEVYVCYDAENLYLFWKLYEDKMDKFDPGPSPDLWDRVSEKDNVQLFLDPDCTRKGLFNFTASAKGSQLDQSTKTRLMFNANWKVCGGRFDKGWTMEMAVPFTGVKYAGNYRGTPQVGDVWGINFCRIESVYGEESQWSLTGSVFGNYGCFGRGFFKGRKTPPQLPKITRLSSEELFFGPGNFSFKIEGTDTLEGKYTFLRDGKDVTGKTIKTGPTVNIPYKIILGGKWSFNVIFTQNGKPVYIGSADKVLPRIKGLLTEISTAVSSGALKLNSFQHPETERLKEKISNLNTLMAQCKELLGKTETLTRNQWHNFVKETGKVRRLWESVEFDINLMRLYPPGDKQQSFGIGTAQSDEKIYRHTVYKGEISKPVTCSLAGNEYESFQLIIIPFWKNLKQVNLKATEFTGENGTIPANSITFFTVDYVRLMNDHPWVTNKNKYEPDILMPYKPFSVEKDSVKSVWVDVYLPKGTPAGIYKGKILVEADGQTVEKELIVTSYGFDLPDTVSIKQNHWLSWHGSYNWSAFYGYKIKYTPELFEKHCKVLSRYRAQLFYSDSRVYYPGIKIYRETDGHYSFDFSYLDKFVKIGRKYHANAFWGVNSIYSLKMFYNPETRIIERSTGKIVRLKKYLGDWLKQFKVVDPECKVYWDSNPLYKDFLKAYAAHLKKLGLIDCSYFELYDEAYDNVTRWKDMVRHQKFLKSFVPELKLLNYGVNPLQVMEGESAIGLEDCWAPHLFQCDNSELLDAIYKRRKENPEEEFWFYACTERQGPGGGWTPYIKYNRSYLGARIIPWFAWKYKIDGFLIYCLGHSQHANNKPADKRWPKTVWEAGRWNGTGTLIYPGPECEAIPSMRLANYRDGMEDYEYFILLKRKIAELDPEKNRKLIKEAEDLLHIDSDIIESVYDWTKDVSVINKKRQQLAQMIQKLNRKK